MREQLLEAAEEMVQRRGLSAVTFQELADAVGLRKPSVFHHIKNKEELSLALIERCGSKHGPAYAEVAESELTAPEKLKGLAGVFENGLEQGRPCLLAALGAGQESLSEEARRELSAMAAGAVGRFAGVFAQGREEGSLRFDGSPDHAAMGFFAMLQGLQTLCRSSGDNSAFGKAAEAYVDSITVEV